MCFKLPTYLVSSLLIQMGLQTINGNSGQKTIVLFSSLSDNTFRDFFLCICERFEKIFFELTAKN